MPALIIPIAIRLGTFAIALAYGPKALREFYDAGTHIWDDQKMRRSAS